MLISKGKVSQVIGPVVDVSFENGVELPTIFDALEVTKKDGTRVVLEVQSHVGENSIRAISMDSTDGFTRGMEVVSTGSAIKMPVGEKIKGRLFNVIGEAIDGINIVSNEGGMPIHREAPKFDQLSTATEILLTGIKVIDLIEPYAKETIHQRPCINRYRYAFRIRRYVKSFCKPSRKISPSACRGQCFLGANTSTVYLKARLY